MQFDVEILDLGQSQVGYLEAWEMQRMIHSDVVANSRKDVVLLLEHEPVYTAGRRTEAFERPMDGTPVIDVDRGGKITWHGPGQLVGYPIMHLPTAMDVVAHVRRLEDVIIGACAEIGLLTERIKGRSGVWVPDDIQARKVCAIGVRVAQGVTMHGFAINCNNDQDWFDRIVPCGLRDAGVTSLSQELGREISILEVAPIVESHLHRVFDPLVIPATTPSPSDASV